MVPPTAADFTNNPNYPGYDTIQRIFGTWNNGIIAAGFKPNDNQVNRSRYAEMQQISEFKNKGVIDLSGQNRMSSYDGICPKGEKFDTKGASLVNRNSHLGWAFYVTINQIEEADYLFLRAYEDKDFTKPPLYKWRVPIDFMDNRTSIFIYKEVNVDGMYNVENMKKYEYE